VRALNTIEMNAEQLRNSLEPSTAFKILLCGHPGMLTLILLDCGLSTVWKQSQRWLPRFLWALSSPWLRRSPSESGYRSS
jgi:hypothetical protein